jgi:hypothetical protein
MVVSHAAPREDDQTSIAEEDRAYCANCIHCKVVRDFIDEGVKYQLRVRCDAGKWKKKLGDEKYHKYFTVARRSIECCDSYEPMGDCKEFLRELRKSLPLKDEIYKN